MDLARDARALLRDRAPELGGADRAPDADEQDAVREQAQEVALRDVSRSRTSGVNTECSSAKSASVAAEREPAVEVLAVLRGSGSRSRPARAGCSSAWSARRCVSAGRRRRPPRRAELRQGGAQPASRRARSRARAARSRRARSPARARGASIRPPRERRGGDQGPAPSRRPPSAAQASARLTARPAEHRHDREGEPCRAPGRRSRSRGPGRAFAPRPRSGRRRARRRGSPRARPACRGRAAASGSS